MTMRHRVESDDDTGTHTFMCECGFMSARHETKKSANARGAEHMQEHETGEPMRELADFMRGEG